MRVVIAGFGRFPGAPVNPSAHLAELVARRRRPAFAGVERSVHVLPTVYAEVDRELPELFAARPDIVLMFGLAGRRRELCIETRARNARSVLSPDASRYRPQTGVIARGQPSSRRGNAPFMRLLAAVRRHGVAVRLSRDAGRYLCNYAYWQALQRSRGGRPTIAFIHIPPVRLRPRKLRRRRQPAMARLAVAAEALLIALIAANRR